ncbi:hypothetical protein ACWGI1_00275 [Streptomyces sp. NPDC054835]
MDVHILGDRLLRIAQKLREVQGNGADTAALEALARLLDTSRDAHELATQTSVSSAACTIDGREAIDLLTKVTAAATAATTWVTAALSSSRRGHRATASEYARTALTELYSVSVTCTDASAALLRHDGFLAAAQADIESDSAPLSGKPEAISETQRQALAHIACGSAVLQAGTPYGRPREVRGAGIVRPATFDALVKRDLVVLTPLPGGKGQQTVSITPSGRRALLAAGAPSPARLVTTRPALAHRAPRAAAARR